jgi:pilus assembly protein Flp/PilA
MLKQTLDYYIARLRISEEGATAIEYGLLAALIALVIIGSVALLGGTLDGVFSDVEAGIP